MSYEGVHELDIQKIGDVIVLRPVRPSWESFFTDLEPLDAHDPFIEELSKRRPVIARDRVTFDDETSEQ
jgi:antitoxin VapB